MAEAPNIYVSNGTCYTGPGNPADMAMIPCGNAYFEPQACCQHNDHCLESSVCYNAAHGVTYVAGCTDEAYDASVCPDKFDDEGAPWLGMSYCDDTSDDWVLCNQEGHPATIVAPDPCACPTATAERSMTLNQAPGIAETASLPDATGLPIDWNTDYYPTIPTAASSSSYSSSSSSIASRSALTSSAGVATTSTAVTVAASPPFPTSFTTSAKIGTAIGASVFGILFIALLAFLILRRRRYSLPQQQQKDHQQQKQKQKQQDLHAPGDTTTGADRALMDPRDIGVAYSSDSHDVSRLSVIAGPAALELDNSSKAARPWSMVSELDGHGDGGGAGGGNLEANHGRGVGRVHGMGGGGGLDEAEPSEMEAPRHVSELPA